MILSWIKKQTQTESGVGSRVRGNALFVSTPSNEHQKLGLSVQTHEPVETFHLQTPRWEGPRGATFLGMPSCGCMHISILSENGQVVAIQGLSNPEVSQNCGQ